MSKPFPSRPEPALAALFTPAHPRVGRYEVLSTPEPIARVAPAEWPLEALEPIDAFGTAGAYDRWKLIRLFGGRRVRVARGWTRAAGSIASVTLLSPYPDPALRSLNAGTLIIRFIDER